jgi:predicted peroxiredoxin
MMSEEKKESMVIIATHGCEDPERASMPFVLGTAALVMESEVTVVLNGVGVLLAKKGCYEHVFAGGKDPLKKLVDNFVELGGKIWVCAPCIKEREITEDMLLETAETVTAGRVVRACIEADATLTF